MHFAFDMCDYSIVYFKRGIQFKVLLQCQTNPNMHTLPRFSAGSIQMTGGGGGFVKA